MNNVGVLILILFLVFIALFLIITASSVADKKNVRAYSGTMTGISSTLFLLLILAGGYVSFSFFNDSFSDSLYAPQLFVTNSGQRKIVEKKRSKKASIVSSDVPYSSSVSSPTRDDALDKHKIEIRQLIEDLKEEIKKSGKEEVKHDIDPITALRVKTMAAGEKLEQAVKEMNMTREEADKLLKDISDIVGVYDTQRVRTATDVANAKINVIDLKPRMIENCPPAPVVYISAPPPVSAPINPNPLPPPQAPVSAPLPQPANKPTVKKFTAEIIQAIDATRNDGNKDKEYIATLKKLNKQAKGSKEPSKQYLGYLYSLVHIMVRTYREIEAVTSVKAPTDDHLKDISNKIVYFNRRLSDLNILTKDVKDNDFPSIKGWLTKADTALHLILCMIKEEVTSQVDVDCNTKKTTPTVANGINTSLKKK